MTEDRSIEELERRIAIVRDNLNQLLGVAGGKFNLGGTFLLNFSILFPLSDSGLKPNVTPVIGFDYVF